jgi:integrase/recombinase XerD
MSMRERVEEYLAMRRSLGFKLAGEGRMLLEFADRLEGTGQTTVTVTAVVAWASEPTEASANHRHRRLGVVRSFARHLAALDPTCEVPPAGLLVARPHRPTPYLYSPAEVIRRPRSRRSCTRPARSRRPCTPPPSRPWFA